MLTCWTDYLTNINVICLINVDSSSKWFLRPALIVMLNCLAITDTAFTEAPFEKHTNSVTTANFPEKRYGNFPRAITGYLATS